VNAGGELPLVVRSAGHPWSCLLFPRWVRARGAYRCVRPLMAATLRVALLANGEVEGWGIGCATATWCSGAALPVGLHGFNPARAASILRPGDRWLGSHDRARQRHGAQHASCCLKGVVTER